jgi:hypothetical protein
MDIRIPVELPSIDLSAVLPLLALVVLVALIVFMLVARSVIQSRALALIVIAAIIVLGSSTIVGGLQAIAGLIGVTGLVAIGLIVTLGRNREVLDVVRTLAEKSTPIPPTLTEQRPPIMLDAPQTTYQLPAAGQTTASRRRMRSVRLPKDLGF